MSSTIEEVKTKIYEIRGEVKNLMNLYDTDRIKYFELGGASRLSGLEGQLSGLESQLAELQKRENILLAAAGKV